MKTPLLDYLMQALEGWHFPHPMVTGLTPLECFECPFATVVDPEDVNVADPGETYYACGLLHKDKVWGEDPICTDDDWRVPLRVEWHALKAARTVPEARP